MPPLPLNGYGREHTRTRYGSLTHGQNLQDVMITGNNGTIDGQGQKWWKRYRQKLLNNTRGPLMQIMYSNSCKDMVIEDNYISVGDDAIAIKGGWDQYGVVYGRPSKNILTRNLMVLSMVR
ncbi:putative pectin lyase/virulence factor [Helianthus anomalus]